MLLDKLAFIENKYDELSVKISDPSIMANQNEWRKLCKEHAELEVIVNAYREYKKVVEDLEANKEMLQEETDKEMKEMLQEEISDLSNREKELDNEIQILGGSTNTTQWYRRNRRLYNKQAILPSGVAIRIANIIPDSITTVSNCTKRPDGSILVDSDGMVEFYLAYNNTINYSIFWQTTEKRETIKTSIMVLSHYTCLYF